MAKPNVCDKPLSILEKENACNHCDRRFSYQKLIDRLILLGYVYKSSVYDEVIAMDRFRFAAARPEGDIVYGAQRPGYPSENVDVFDVTEWISFMQKRGIRRVCCLLPTKQLAYYRANLLKKYSEAFGELNVCRAGIEDYHLCDHAMLEGIILPFLVESERLGASVVVHCSGGSGRTGHVLAAWLVRQRSLTVDNALEVVSTRRNPWEAVECGYATEKELRCLLAGRNFVCDD